MITVEELKAVVINSYMNDPDFQDIMQQIENFICEVAKNNYCQIILLSNDIDYEYPNFNSTPTEVRSFFGFCEDYFHKCTISVTNDVMEKYGLKIINVFRQNGFKISTHSDITQNGFKISTHSKKNDIINYTVNIIKIEWGF